MHICGQFPQLAHLSFQLIYIYNIQRYINMDEFALTLNFFNNLFTHKQMILSRLIL